MKKILSIMLAVVLLVSAVPTALATNDHSQGTQVVYQAAGNEAYTITVPALLVPGGNGTVTLEGTWASDRVVSVTAEPTVTLTNSIKAEDQKVLNVHFDGISEAGNNTGSQTFTESVSVDNITNALFGIWSGKFNYNVKIENYINSELNHLGTIPKGAIYTAVDGTVYSSGDTFPDMVNTGDTYYYQDYTYAYNQYMMNGSWRTDESFNGWGLFHNASWKAEMSPILESINGKPITSLNHTFYCCDGLEVIPEIPSTVTTLEWAFVNCTKITDASQLQIPQNVTNMESAFNGCESLSYAPSIPSSVTDIGRVFYDCTNLTTIRYAGTVEQWNALKKSLWNNNCPITEVICSDGTVAIS